MLCPELTRNQPPFVATRGCRLLGARPVLDGVASGTVTRVSRFPPSKDAGLNIPPPPPTPAHSYRVSSIGYRC